MLCEFLWLVSLEIQCLVQFPYYNNYFVRMISFLAWFFICFYVRLLLEFAGVADIGWTVFIGKLFFSCYNLCWNDGYICYSVLCVLLLFMDHILIYLFYYFRLVDHCHLFGGNFGWWPFFISWIFGIGTCDYRWVVFYIEIG